jgi:hypothetical protein
VISSFDNDPSFMARTAQRQIYLLIFSQITSPFAFDNYGGESTFRLSPIYFFSDNVTWLKDKHALKFGGELRLISSLSRRRAAMRRSLTEFLWVWAASTEQLSPARI